MRAKPTSLPTDSRTRSPEFEALAQAGLAALIRARRRAELLAAQTGTAIVQWEDGKIVYLWPTLESIAEQDARAREAQDGQPSAEGP